MPSRCVIVLGVPRSGTSAVAGVLHALGVNMGEGHLQPADGNNRAGYWEDLRWQKFNKQVTGERYGHNEPAEIGARLAGKYELLARECNEQPLWGMKDPRLCFTLPFILPYLEDVRLVAVYRSAAATAKSLMWHSIRSYHGRLRMTLEQAMERRDLWAEAMNRQVATFKGPFLAVQYEDLLRCPGRGVVNLAEFAFDKTGLAPDTGSGIRFVDKGLKHHG